jgi:hypothetical protein
VTYLLGVVDGDGLLVFEADRGEIADDLVLASTDEPGKVADRARITLEEALGKLKPSLSKIIHTLKEISPDNATVEFGLKIGGETGIVIAKGSAEVNFVVRMSWTFRQDNASG